MKKSHIATLVVFFILVPATILLCRLIPGRSYYVSGTLIIAELMIPFFMAFEGRRPQARELVVIAVLCALSIAGRVAIPIPNFKACFAVIMIAGIAFGPETGFIVGALTALASDFFLGQGAYMPWQMMAYGAGGMLAGFLFQKGRVPRKPVPMAVYGLLGVVLWIGPMLDVANAFLIMPNLTMASLGASFASGFTVNLIQGGVTALLMLALGKPLLDKLERVKIKYGMGDG